MTERETKLADVIKDPGRGSGSHCCQEILDFRGWVMAWTSRCKFLVYIFYYDPSVFQIAIGVNHSQVTMTC
jgi:hypothetical protein